MVGGASGGEEKSLFGGEIKQLPWRGCCLFLLLLVLFFVNRNGFEAWSASFMFRRIENFLWEMCESARGGG